MEELLKQITLSKKFSERKKLIEQKYQLLGKGTARMVYDLKNGYVLKLAKNEKGLAQNMVESNPKIQKEYPNYVAKISSFDKKGIYLIQEKIKPLTEKRFEELTGLQGAGFMYYLRFGLDWDNPFYKKVKELVSKFKLDKFDVANISSWGENKKGKIVLSDYGMDCNVAKKLYKAKYDC